MPAIPRLASLATAVPRCALDQGAVIAAATRLFRDRSEVERLLPVFANTGIRRRYSAVPLDWFSAPHDWPERNRRYRESALDLLEAAAGRALDRAGLPRAAVGAVVAVSTTGIATPSLDALLIERMRLPAETQRLPIFGLGCAGGAIGLGHAAALAATMPDKAVLFCVVELCSLTFRRDDASNGNIVAAALFGDGAAAAVLHRSGRGPAIVASGVHTWPKTLDLMGWEVAEDGLKPVFSRDIPRLAAGRLGEAAAGFLGRQGLALGDIDRFICHPGGPKVIEACEQAFGLLPGTLDDGRAVLRDFGNMSAASVMFVLDRLLAAEGTASGWRRGLLTAFGPGFSAGFVVLDNR